MDLQSRIETRRFIAEGEIHLQQIHQLIKQIEATLIWQPAQACGYVRLFWMRFEIKDLRLTTLRELTIRQRQTARLIRRLKKRNA